MRDNEIKKNDNEQKTLINFLKKTREGRFARVNEVPTPFIRFKIRQEESYVELNEEEEQYYYSIH